MGESGFFVDTKDFDRRFSMLIKHAIPELVQKGLFDAANEALRDADKEAPYIPFLKGDLSGSKEVQKPRNLKDLFIEFGYNIVYAARLHEDGLETWNWTRPGSGPKWLEKKLIRYKEKYIEIVAETIKDGQGPIT